MYTDEGCVSFSTSEAACLKRARELLEAPEGSDAGHAAVRLSGCLQLPDVQIEASPVTLKFTLPTEYPAVRPALQIIANAPRYCTHLARDISQPALCCMPGPVPDTGVLGMPVASYGLTRLCGCREQLDELSAVLEACVQEHVGTESLLLCAAHMLGEISDRLSSGILSRTDTSAAARASVAPRTGPCSLSRTVVWCAAVKLAQHGSYSHARVIKIYIMYIVAV